MCQILILYYSKHGSTEKMARLIARGVASVNGCHAVLRTVESQLEGVVEPKDPLVSEQDMADCDGLVLGSPCYFGNMASPLKQFIDSTGNLWFSGKMEGKPGSVFVSGSSLHGGQESTLLNMMVPLLHYGMVVCGLPYSEQALLHTQSGGSPYGATHWGNTESNQNIDQQERELCLAQGKRMAQLAQKLMPNK